MRRQLLTTLWFTTLSIVSYAATFMQVKTTDGKIVKYNVEGVKEVTFVTDTTSSDRAYVDLGLPSGTLWATCNIGATKPEEFGDYFAWGETETKEIYNWSTYKYAKANEEGYFDSLTKYNFGEHSEGAIDSLSTLLPEDDVATVNWGSEWRMPTNDEQRELREECYMVWTNSYNGSDVSGVIFYKAKNSDDKGIYITCYETPSSDYSTLFDAHVFLPAAGRIVDSFVGNVGYDGLYWSSSLNDGYELYARGLDFFDTKVYWEFNRHRCEGFPVRAVRSQK